jgi:hypothetical protein
MLVFSFFIPLYSFVIALFNNTYTVHVHRHKYLPLLIHIPYKFGPISDCILVAPWFYNQFYTFFHYISSFYKRQHTTLLPTPSTIKTKCRLYYSPSLHHLLFLTYIIINCTIVSAITTNQLSFTSLSIMPSLLTFFYLHSQHQLRLPSLFSSSTTPILLPQCPTTNKEKFCYLSAWQSIAKDNPHIMNFSPGSTPICIDTGASCCICNNKEDFIFLTHSSNSTLRGIGSGLSVQGTGTLQWSITNDDGDDIVLNLLNSLYVPSIPMCLLSPQHMAQQTHNSADGFATNTGLLTFAGHKHTIHYNASNNLPIFFTSSNITSTPSIDPSTITSNFNSTTTTALIASENFTPINNTECSLTTTQRKLLRVHQCMGHLNMTRIPQLACEGYFGASHVPISTCDIPLCRACLHGKQQRNPVTPRTVTGPLDMSHLTPGDCVSGDQLESTSPGLVPTYRGTPTTSKYHASSFAYADHYL